MWSQKYQGTTEHDEPFGYVAEDGNGGGYFFTWRETLAKTLSSIEEDTEAPPKRLLVRTVEREVRRMWRIEAAERYSSLVPRKA